jgi:hypothetical protein
VEVIIIHFLNVCLSIFVEVPKLFVILFLLNCLAVPAQNQPLARNAFMNDYMQEAFDYWIISKPNTTFHSSFKPYLSSTYQNASDSTIPFKHYAFNNQYLSKTYSRNFDKSKCLNIQLHPILDLDAGIDLLTNKLVLSGIGGTHIKANIRNNFTFAASVYGGKTQFPFFNDTAISKKNLIPEIGQAYGTNKSGYSFFDYTGSISYSPGKNKIFNFQAGRDKHFIGDGYRSVLLSDFSPAYPFFRINTNIWRIQYNVWYTAMNDVTNANELKQNYRKKYGTFHYLSYNIIKEINIGFFENIVWRGTDTNQVRTFEVNYLNPIIFFRPQEYSVGSPDNSFVGFNTNVTLFKSLKLYAQIGLDEFYLKEVRAGNGWWANKVAWQFGAKYINAFRIKGLKLQIEYNEARPYTYTHGLVDQNYSHYGQALAHPAGANFKELLGFITYRKNKWELSAQLMYLTVGKDSLSATANVGQNIFLSYNTRNSDYGNFTGQGIRTDILQSQLKFTWFIIPDLNMRLEACYMQRSEKNSLKFELQNPFISIGFKTSFWNSYRDF